MNDNHVSHSRIGDLDVTLTSELIQNKKMDTKIAVTSGTLCWVAGSEIDSFVAELNEIINKYRI